MKQGTLRIPVLPLVLALASALTACGGDDPEKLVQSARAYLEKRDNAAALIELKNALQARPDAAEARFLLGQALLATGDAPGAEAEFRKASEYGSSADDVTPWLVKAMLAQGQVRKVTEQFAETRLAAPAAQAELQTLLASAWLAQGKQDKAEAGIASALQAKPGHPTALLAQARLAAAKGDFDSALGALEQVLAGKTQLEEAYRLKGDFLSYGKRADAEALAAYRESVRVRPDYSEGQAAVVRLLMKSGELEQAAKELDKLVGMAKGKPMTLFLQARLAFLQKDYQAAREHAQQLLRLSPGSPQALELAGTVEHLLKSWVQAEALLAKAVAMAPELKGARRILVDTYLRTGQLDKALATLPSDLDKGETDSATLALAGRVYMMRGDVERAQRYLARSSKLDPDNPAKRTTLALSKLMAGKADTAFDELQDIAASDNGVVADMALVSAHLRRKEFDQALAALDGMEKKRPNDPAMAQLRGQVLIRKGDIAGARQAMERALASDADYFPAIAALAAMDMADKKQEQAQKRFEELLKRKPKHLQAMLALAELKARQGADKDEVAGLLRKAVEAVPGEAAPRLALVAHHLQHKEPKEALTVASNAAAALPQNAEVLDALGRTQMAANESNQALGTYGKLAALQPRSTLPYLRMAVIHAAAKDSAAAAESLRKALEIQPDLLVAQQGLAGLAVQGEKTPDALAIVRDVQKQRPQQPVGYLMEGDIQAAAGKWQAAAEAYGRGLKPAPATELAVKYHGATVAAGKKPEAARFAAEWQRQWPKDLGFTLYLGDRAMAVSEYTEAARQYQKVLDQQPDNPLVLNNMAWSAGKLGRKDALAFAEKANQVAPNKPALMDTWAVLLADGKEYARALELERKVVEMQPAVPLFKLNFAKIQLKAGDKAAAKSTLEELAKLGDKIRENERAEVEQLLKTL
jgi:putative PEP-CTERM system TPR-repeat lipoprotein